MSEKMTDEKRARIERQIKDYEATLENLNKHKISLLRDMRNKVKYIHEIDDGLAQSAFKQIKLDETKQYLEALYNDADEREDYADMIRVKQRMLKLEKEIEKNEDRPSETIAQGIASSHYEFGLTLEREQKKIDDISGQIAELRHMLDKDKIAKRRAEYARRCDYTRMPNHDCIVVLPRKNAFVSWHGISDFARKRKYEAYAHISFYAVKEEEIMQGRIICINGEFYRGVQTHYVVHKMSNDYYMYLYNEEGKRTKKVLTDYVAINMHELFSDLEILQTDADEYTLEANKLYKLLTSKPRLVEFMPLYLFDHEDTEAIVREACVKAIANVAEGLRSLNRTGEYIKPYRKEIMDKLQDRIEKATMNRRQFIYAHDPLGYAKIREQVEERHEFAPGFIDLDVKGRPVPVDEIGQRKLKEKFGIDAEIQPQGASRYRDEEWYQSVLDPADDGVDEEEMLREGLRKIIGSFIKAPLDQNVEGEDEEISDADKAVMAEETKDSTDDDTIKDFNEFNTEQKKKK